MLKKILTNFRIPLLSSDSNDLVFLKDRYSSKNGNYFIKLSSFSNVGDLNLFGGAIYLYADREFSFNMYDTTFYTCSAKGGGAFYVYGNAEGVLHSQRLCGYNCISHSKSNFCFTHSTSKEKENFLSLTSINSCSDDESSGESTCLLEHGTVYCEQLNASNNKALKNSALNIKGLNQNLVKFSSFVGNTAGASTIIFSSKRKLELEKINFIDNTQLLDTEAMIKVTNEGKSLVTSSVFKCSSQNILFDCESDAIILKDVSLFNFTNKNELSGFVVNAEATTNSLEHYQAKMCHADNPVTKDMAIIISGLTLIAIGVCMLIAFFILLCIGNKNKLNSVYEGDLPESLYEE